MRDVLFLRYESATEWSATARRANRPKGLSSVRYGVARASGGCSSPAVKKAAVPPYRSLGHDHTRTLNHMYSSSYSVCRMLTARLARLNAHGDEELDGRTGVRPTSEYVHESEIVTVVYGTTKRAAEINDGEHCEDGGVLPAWVLSHFLRSDASHSSAAGS